MDVADIRVKAHALCSEYLGGVWKTLKQDDIIIEPVHGGFVNFIFKLSLPPNHKPIGTEPENVLMRNFSNKLKSSQFAIMNEHIITLLLAGKKIAPNVYGVFDGGRFDEFIESRVLKSQDFKNPNILEVIVQKLAQLHCLQLPISKDPSLPNKKIDDLLKKALSKNSVVLKQIVKEFEWFNEIRVLANSPVVFSHNDFHMNNMLIRITPNCSPEDLIRFVDYEISGYNYRANDLSRLLGCFCYYIQLEPPYFKVNYDLFPSEERQKDIFKIYIQEIKKQTNCTLDLDEETNRLLEEVKPFNLIGHFYGILFSHFDTIEMTVKINISGMDDPIFQPYLKEKDNFLKLH